MPASISICSTHHHFDMLPVIHGGEHVNEVFVSCDGHPFDEDDKKTNWRVCAWEKSVNEEQAGSVVLHKCENAKEARALVNAVIESGIARSSRGVKRSTRPLMIGTKKSRLSSLQTQN